MREYDVPITAIRKLQNLLDENKTPEQNIAKIKSLPSGKLKEFGLINYEVSKVRGAL